MNFENDLYRASFFMQRKNLGHIFFYKSYVIEKIDLKIAIIFQTISFIPQGYIENIIILY